MDGCRLVAVGPSGRLSPELRAPGVYGFSFVFRKTVHEQIKFLPLDQGADGKFVASLAAAGKTIKYLRDEAGLTVHLLHYSNVSLILPQFVLPPFLTTRLIPGL